jgi:hypothetical protein
MFIVTKVVVHKHYFRWLNCFILIVVLWRTVAIQNAGQHNKLILASLISK